MNIFMKSFTFAFMTPIISLLIINFAQFITDIRNEDEHWHIHAKYSVLFGSMLPMLFYCSKIISITHD